MAVGDASRFCVESLLRALSVVLEVEVLNLVVLCLLVEAHEVLRLGDFRM